MKSGLRVAGVVGIAAVMSLSAAPARAQNLNDVGRLLQNQLQGGQRDDGRDRDAYERGRQDQAEQARREGEARRRAGDDRRRFDEDQRRRYEGRDGQQRELDRQRFDQQRAVDDDRRAREQPRRY